MKNDRMFHLSPSFAPFWPSTALPTSVNDTSPTSSLGAVQDTIHPLPTSECETAVGSSGTCCCPSPAVSVPTP